MKRFTLQRMNVAHIHEWFVVDNKLGKTVAGFCNENEAMEFVMNKNRVERLTHG